MIRSISLFIALGCCLMGASCSKTQQYRTVQYRLTDSLHIKSTLHYSDPVKYVIDTTVKPCSGEEEIIMLYRQVIFRKDVYDLRQGSTNIYGLNRPSHIGGEYTYVKLIGDSLFVEAIMSQRQTTSEHYIVKGVLQ